MKNGVRKKHSGRGRLRRTRAVASAGSPRSPLPARPGSQPLLTPGRLPASAPLSAQALVLSPAQQLPVLLPLGLRPAPAPALPVFPSGQCPDPGPALPEFPSVPCQGGPLLVLRDSTWLGHASADLPQVFPSGLCPAGPGPALPEPRHLRLAPDCSPICTSLAFAHITNRRRAPGKPTPDHR